MGKRFEYFYYMIKESDKIQPVVPSHVEYWEKFKLKNIWEVLLRIDPHSLL